PNMSNSKYRPGGLKGAQQAQQQAQAAPTDYAKLMAEANARAERLKQAEARRAAEQRENRADTHGVDAKAAEAQAAFHQAVKDEPEPETSGDLSDEQAIRIMNNMVMMMNHLANLSTHAIDQVNPELANKVFYEDLIARSSTPERRARPHPLMALSNFVTRCAYLASRLLMITKPHLFAAAEAAVAKARTEHKKIKAAADKMVASVQAAAKPAPAS